jgi:DNA-binding response OmpR family regulator
VKGIRILVAEDDRNILVGLTDTLEGEGYTVVGATDGEQALRLFGQQHFDLVVLDIMMPGRSGYDVCREIRRRDQSTPIIMLTAKSEEVDKVVGLELGADDYITKPFGVHELLARIGSILRRARRAAQPEAARDALPPLLRMGEAEIDRKKYRVRLGRRERELTAREVRLLEVFYAHPGDVMSRDALLNAVWGINYLGTTRTLDQHIAQLRKKIEKDVREPKVILTVHGVGYKYEPGGPRST